MVNWTKILWVILAGSAGAIVPVAIKEQLTRRQRLVYVGVGMLMAAFVAPAVSEALVPSNDYVMQGGVAFLFGALGWKLAEIMLRLVDRHGGDLVESVANRFIGKQGDKK